MTTHHYTYVQTNPPDSYDLRKPAPVFNTGIDILPSFGPMLVDLSREFHLSKEDIIVRLLIFCASHVPYETVRDFLRQLEAFKA